MAEHISTRAHELGISWIPDRVRGSEYEGARTELPVRGGSLIVHLTVDGHYAIQVWKNGYDWIHGIASEVEAVIGVAVDWESGVSITEAVRRWPFLKYDRLGLAHEQGKAVDVQWDILINDPELKNLQELLKLASKRSRLRILFPWVGQVGSRLGFSRCTGYPFTNDIPAIDMGAEKFFVVNLVGRGVVGEFTSASDALDNVVAAIPESVGPAVPGTAADVDPSSRRPAV